MNKYNIAKEYVQARQEQNRLEDQLITALNALGSDSSTINLKGPVLKAYYQLVFRCLGQTALDWLDWWIWETSIVGDQPKYFQFNNQHYHISDFDNFLKVILNEDD